VAVAFHSLAAVDTAMDAAGFGAPGAFHPLRRKRAHSSYIQPDANNAHNKHDGHLAAVDTATDAADFGALEPLLVSPDDHCFCSVACPTEKWPVASPSNPSPPT